MRRLFAIVLTMLISFPLIAPAFAMGDEAKLPACCRKSGKHSCGMAKMAGDSAVHPDQPILKSLKSKCPFYPTGNSGPATSLALESGPAQFYFASAASQPAVHAQPEALYRISFTRACQKRGPPMLAA